MRGTRSLLFTVAASSAILACNRDGALAPAVPPRVPTVGTQSSAAGFATSEPALAHALVTGAQLTPLVSVGDVLPGGVVWAPTPDGLGAHASGSDLVLYANHELSAGGVPGTDGAPHYQYARVSRLVLDPATRTVTSASYPVNGSELLERLCSATWVGVEEGFPAGQFLTGEESVGTANDGIQLAVGADGKVTPLPWLGRYAHENQIAVPGFPGKTVMLGFDDSRGKSELYMYVGATAADVLDGTGTLYVFTSRQAANVAELETGRSIVGDFVEVPDAADVSSDSLQKIVTALGAFPFVRLEDGDYDHFLRRGGRPAVYFVDTGAEQVLCGTAPCDAHGSIYRLELATGEPTKGARLILEARSTGAGTGWASPDNVAFGQNSLMVQEDPAYAGFARAPRIYRFGVRRDGRLDDGVPVVELNNPECNDALGTCWESSGIIDASEWFGPDAWLFDIQAHTLPVPSQQLAAEGGQLLLLQLAASGGPAQRAPVLGSLTAYPREIGRLVGFDAELLQFRFSDPDGGPWTARIDWGDGEVNEFPLAVLPGSYQTFHAYATAGRYTITMRITDRTGLPSNTSTTSVTAAGTPGTLAGR